MKGQKGWNRREFAQLMGYSALSSAGLCSSLLPPSGARSSVSFAYVASERNEIHAYASGANGWSHLQTIASERPVALAVAANRRALYAVNEVDTHCGLPMGTVESFSIAADGRLAKLNRRALSLSATMPRHAAISPDGKNLMVAVREGGAYNVLPIAEDGSVGRVSAVLKEIGVERDGVSLVARPQMVAFDKAGRVVATDAGTGRLSVLHVTEDGLEVHARAETQDQAALSVAMHPSGKMLYAMREDGLTCYGYDTSAGRVEQTAQHVEFACANAGSGALAVHPNGAFVYAGRRDGGVALWIADRSTGRLRDGGVHGEAMGELRALELARNGRSLVALSRGGDIAEAAIDTGTGAVGAYQQRARVDSASCLTVL